MSTDLEQLKEMGFEPERAAVALKKSGNLSQALEWLEKHQDQTWEDLQQQEDAAAAHSEPAAGESGDMANSLICNDCNKKFRDANAAQFHASKSGHTDFAESTDEIKPLTEDEKAAKLQELREKLAAKRAGQSEQDKVEKRQNEMIRRKATKEGQDIKEELQKKEQIKEAQAKRKEKQADIDARKKVLMQIEADKQARREKAEKEKALRAGVAPPIVSEPSVTTKSAVSKPSASYSEARLRLQTPNGTITKTFPAETTLFEVAHALNQESGLTVSSFTSNFPKKVFDQTDFGQTLKEAGMVPSSALIVR